MVIFYIAKKYEPPNVIGSLGNRIAPHIQGTAVSGFDLSFYSRSHVPLNSSAAVSGCAMLQCNEKLADDPDDHTSTSRKITALTIYMRRARDGNQWRELTTLSTIKPRDQRVSDGRRFSGDLTDRQANITVMLHKTVDCSETQFACVAVSVDANGQNNELKSFVGGSTAFELDPRSPSISEDFKSLSAPADGLGEIKQLVTSLGEKLNCMEKRLEDSANGAKRLEDKLETFKTTVTDQTHNLETEVRSEILSSSNRLQDRLDRLENRLEDKVSQVGTRPLQDSDDSFVGSSLRQIVESVESTNANISELYDYVKSARPPQISVPSTADNMTRLASKLASLSSITSNLVTSVDALQQVCPSAASDRVEEYFDVLGTGRKEWRLVFRGTSYNNVKIYPAYIHGTGIPLEVEAGCKQFNHSLPCVNHYRNRDAFENWTNIDEVLLAVFDKGRVVKRIVFNGRGSTITSWFEKNRVILSSWTDLKTKEQNIFSIEGETRPQYMRRFYINFDYTTCDAFGGWFFAGEAEPGCPMDKNIARPFFQYAVGDTYAVWSSANVARADSIGVFLKYEDW
ncbi:hypothetical protein ElyMa_002608200 [Elysia marginata]|uniref:Fibrinogen C-terminal domain-containing protein n=1 Tax=Elysia marginata TaxID=1093978 RepID=A0AAV4H2V4_9GAST|nr:hypothetical protein ElyMa_002608200 [Elysia marginata]